jgi:hypothetical protein
MGFFKSIKKAFKKVTKGISKLFKAVVKPFTKLMQNKVFKGIMLAASIVTGGIAIYGGIMGAVGAAGTQAWSTLSLTSKFVTGAKAFVSGAQAAVGSAMGSVKGALGVNGASGGAGITASASQAGAGTAQSMFAAANPELAKLGVNLSASPTASLGQTGLNTGGLGVQSATDMTGSVNGSGLTDAVAASEGVGGAGQAAQGMVNSGTPFQVDTTAMGGYSGGTGTGSSVFDGAYKTAKTVGDAANQQDGKGGLLSQAGSFLSGGGGGVAMIAGQALSGMAQGKAAQAQADDERKYADDKEKNNWYNSVGAGDLAVGDVRVPKGLLSYTGNGQQQIDSRGQQGFQDINERAKQVREQYGYA